MEIAKQFSGNVMEALKANPDHLFVRNAINKTRMDILLDVRDETGKSTCITVPKTWIPIDLLDYVDAESLKKSVQLRSFVRSGVLKLCDPEDSVRILKTEDAHNEAKRRGVKDYRTDLTEGEAEKSDVHQVVIPEASTEARDFYDINLIQLEDCLQKDEADKIASEVCGTYLSSADEKLYADEKTTEKIKKMREIASDSKWESATKQFDELLATIEKNAPAKSE